MTSNVDDRPEVQALFANLRAALPSLETLLEEVCGTAYEDGLYRFYHHSFKVYRVQELTVRMVEAFQDLAPGRPLNSDFSAIFAEGTRIKWGPEHNRCWLEVTRPIVEVFLHAKYFLEMAVRFGNALDAPPSALPYGWGAFLYLYELR